MAKDRFDGEGIFPYVEGGELPRQADSVDILTAVERTRRSDIICCQPATAYQIEKAIQGISSTMGGITNRTRNRIEKKLQNSNS